MGIADEDLIERKIFSIDKGQYPKFMFNSRGELRTTAQFSKDHILIKRIKKYEEILRKNYYLIESLEKEIEKLKMERRYGKK